MKTKGLTIIELLIVILITVIAVSALFKGYDLILRSYIRHTNMAETGIETEIFKEIFRRDIELACFCLTNNEIDDALKIQDSTFTIKSTLAGLLSAKSKKLGYVNEDCSISLLGEVSVGGFNDEACRVISANRSSYIDCVCSNYLNCTTSSSEIDIDTSSNDCYNDEPLLVCGYGDSLDLSYYLSKPSDSKYFPKKCNPSTQILYRQIGTSTIMSLLECTLYFKVGAILRDNSWSTGTFSAQDVKEIVAYIIFQNGKKERFEIYPEDKIRIVFPDNSYEDVTIPDKHYRWELIEIHARPINCWEKII